MLMVLKILCQTIGTDFGDIKILESYHIEHALPSQSITVHQNHDQTTPKHEKTPKT